MYSSSGIYRLQPVMVNRAVSINTVSFNTWFYDDGMGIWKEEWEKVSFNTWFYKDDEIR